MFKKKGFTLAEVIIVIGIVGIIAEITIPSLIAQTRKTEILSGLRKSYATLQTVKLKAESENGPYIGWGFQATTAGMLTIFNNIIAPNLRISKNCGSSPTGCWAYGYNIDGTTDGTYPLGYNSRTVYALLADGSSLAIYDRSTPTTFYEMLIFVDLNGLKRPNKWGIDRFIFYVETDHYSNNKLVPFGNDEVFSTAQADRDTCWNSANGDSAWWSPGKGLTCSLTIIKYDNWQLTDENYYW